MIKKKEFSIETENSIQIKMKKKMKALNRWNIQENLKNEI